MIPGIAIKDNRISQGRALRRAPMLWKAQRHALGSVSFRFHRDISYPVQDHGGLVGEGLWGVPVGTPERTSTVSMPLSIPAMTSVSIRSPTTTTSSGGSPAAGRPVRIISGLEAYRRNRPACRWPSPPGQSAPGRPGQCPFQYCRIHRVGTDELAPCKTRFTARVRVSRE